jgi:hypothetical protein
MTKLTVAKSNLANAPKKKSPFARLEVLTVVKMSSVLRCHAVSTDKQLPMFRGSVAPPSSGPSMDRATVPVVSRRPLHTEDRVRSQDGPCGNFGQQTGNGTGFLQVHHHSSVSIIPPTPIFINFSFRRYTTYVIGSIVK